MGIGAIREAFKVAGSMDDFTNANALIEGYRRVRKASGWKDSTQKYGINLLTEIRDLQLALRSGTYEQGQGSVFRTCEQGHLRLVKALTVRDTVMQHSLCNDVLLPTLTPHLIHDNGASLKGKGISFTRKRFEEHLRWHFRRYGREGYILKVDFRKYFDNIRHDVMENGARPFIAEKPFAVETLRKVLKANRIDISFTDDPEYDRKVFNSLEYEKLEEGIFTGRRFMDKSIGIGSPVSQVAGIFVPSPIDTYCKTVKGIHCYDAYMDDRIIIHPDKQFLWELLEEIREIADCLGIFIHPDKTQIIKLSHGFTFLKTKYLLTETGRIVKRIPRDVVTRERRKLKKLARFVIRGELSMKQFEEQYGSWRGDKDRYNSFRTISNMDILFRRLKSWITKSRNSLEQKSSASQT